jgi:hypothetical protein
MTGSLLRGRNGVWHPVPVPVSASLASRRAPCRGHLEGRTPLPLSDVLRAYRAYRRAGNRGLLPGVEIKRVCLTCLRIVSPDDLPLLLSLRGDPPLPRASSPLRWSGAGQADVPVAAREVRHRLVARGVPITVPLDVTRRGAAHFAETMGCPLDPTATVYVARAETPYRGKHGRHLSDETGRLASLAPPPQPSAEQRRAAARGRATGGSSFRDEMAELQVVAETRGRHNWTQVKAVVRDCPPDAKVVGHAAPKRVGATGPLRNDVDRQDFLARAIPAPMPELRRPMPGHGESARLMSASPRRPWVDVGNDPGDRR